MLGGVIVTSFYSFRLLFLTFHGKERFRDVHHDDHGHGHDDHHAADAHHGDAHHDDHGHGHGGPHEPHETPWW